MFSDTFLASHESSSDLHDQKKHPKSPLQSCEEWMQLEGLEQWPCTSPSETPSNLNPDDIIGSLDDIREDLRTHSREHSQ